MSRIPLGYIRVFRYPDIVFLLPETLIEEYDLLFDLLSTASWDDDNTEYSRKLEQFLTRFDKYIIEDINKVKVILP